MWKKGSICVRSLFQKVKWYGWWKSAPLDIIQKKVLRESAPRLSWQALSGTDAEWALPLSEKENFPAKRIFPDKQEAGRRFRLDWEQGRSHVKWHFKALTIFLMSFLIQVDVGFHVPDELVSQKLRFGSCPQDVFPNVTHLQPQADQWGSKFHNSQTQCYCF